MLTSREIALGTALVLSVTHDIKFRIKAHKAAKQILRVSERWEIEMAVSEAKVQYLLDICDKNGVVPDEFDLIALTTLFSQ